MEDTKQILPTHHIDRRTFPSIMRKRPLNSDRLKGGKEIANSHASNQVPVEKSGKSANKQTLKRAKQMKQFRGSYETAYTNATFDCVH